MSSRELAKYSLEKPPQATENPIRLYPTESATLDRRSFLRGLFHGTEQPLPLRQHEPAPIESSPLVPAITRRDLLRGGALLGYGAATTGSASVVWESTHNPEPPLNKKTKIGGALVAAGFGAGVLFDRLRGVHSPEDEA